MLSATALFFSGFVHLYGQEEFVGPLPGWVNVKTRFGAKGDGVHDDTKAIQRALDSLTQPVINFNAGRKAYMVIYLPAGTYCISSTLSLKGKIGVTIIGASPQNTIIKWKGADSATMLLANGSAYFKISRFTWDANTRRNIEAVGIHWKDKWTDERSQSSAPVNIEISDNIFIGNCRYGISGGSLPGAGGTGQMDSEISIRRCVFNRCSEAGLHIVGYNALDYWVYDCQFIDCKDGINCNFGNYHVYRSYFRASANADFHNTNGYYTSVRGCYSEGSFRFSLDEGASSNPFKRIFQANTVVAPRSLPIFYRHLGKITFLDNFFDASKDASVHAFIETGTWAAGNIQVLSINNNYRDKTPVKFISGPNKFYSYKDNLATVSTPQKAQIFLNELENTPPGVQRTIITVPANANAKEIQGLIDKAMKEKGKKPVIYFPVGKYTIDAPLFIAAGADLQLIGDGYLYASLLIPGNGFPAGKALLNIAGPTNVTIRDIQLGDFSKGIYAIDAIHFNNIDQVSSQAFVEQLYTNSHHSIEGRDLDYLRIQETNSFYSDGNSISGGALVQAGKGTAGLYSFGGQFAGIAVDKNARLVAKDCWWEGAMRKPLNLSGKGYITIDGAMIAPVGADSNTTVSVNRFSGNISLLNMYLQGGISVDPVNPDLNLLFWNIHFYYTLDPLKFNRPGASYKAAFMGFNTQCFISGDKKCDNINTVDDTFKSVDNLAVYLPAMLADDRAAMPRKYLSQPPGVSNILISRVSAGGFTTAIRFAK